jgi:hypothetical protein
MVLPGGPHRLTKMTRLAWHLRPHPARSPPPRWSGWFGRQEQWKTETRAATATGEPTPAAAAGPPLIQVPRGPGVGSV